MAKIIFMISPIGLVASTTIAPACLYLSSCACRHLNDAASWWEALP